MKLQQLVQKKACKAYKTGCFLSGIDSKSNRFLYTILSEDYFATVFFVTYKYCFNFCKSSSYVCARPLLYIMAAG